MKYQVAIGKYPDLKGVLDKIGGLGNFIKKNERVFIKPNICAPRSSDTGAVTSPGLIEELIVLLKEITQNIQIGDSSISEFRGLEAIKVSGIYDVAVKHGVEVIDLTAAPKAERGPFIISKPILDADKIINVPVLKTHEVTGVTISLKNMMGIIPGHLKTDLHKIGLADSLVRLAQIIKPHLNIVDAGVCQEGRGPLNGTPKNLGLLVAGDNQVAVDAVCCKIMGISPRMIQHIRLAEKAGLGSTDDIDIAGFKEEYVDKFNLPITYKNWILRFGMQLSDSGFKRFIEKNNKIEINSNKCSRCGLCVKTCPVGAMTMTTSGPAVDYKKCIFCLCCYETCLPDAIKIKEPLGWLLNFIRKIGGFN
ncbi:MAG: DUF362 domain-containing protein [Candidatus Nealsonbacteria bacterium]